MPTTTTQIYAIVNSVVSQSMGRTDLTVVDETGLISLGNTILNSSTSKNQFVEGLVDRIGKTIISYRQYSSKFRGLLMNDFEYGAVLQKIKVQMPDAEEDQSYDLKDGASVDQYKVNKPKAVEKLFDSETPYQFHITIQNKQLKRAFTSATEMGAFYSAVYGEMQNKIELAIEDLGRNCIANFIAEVSNTSREIKLLTEYKALNTTASALTATTCLQDVGFLKFASQRIQEISSLFTEMTTGIFNDGSVTRHTPVELQKMFILKKFSQALETNVLANAFHKEYDELGEYQEVSFWQAIKKPFEINVKRASDKAAKNVQNIIGILFDKEAIGINQSDVSTDTSPYNAAGRYYNIFHHENHKYFNDLSENGLIFTLN